MQAEIGVDQLRFIVEQARMHLAACISQELRTGGWQETRSPDEIIDLHMKPERKDGSSGLNELLSAILFSAQNRQDANRVIEGSVKGKWDGLRKLLLDFDPEAILRTWNTSDDLFQYIQESTEVTGEKRDTARSRWPQFCKSILSASRFITRFDTSNQFFAWIETFRATPDTAAALPLILAEEIDGFSLALACDFLKELGYKEFPKPDVHIKNLAHRLRISSATSDYMLLRDLMRLGPSLGKLGHSLYTFDKYLWLLGSGRFYLVVEDGYELSIGRQIEPFVSRIRQQGYVIADDADPKIIEGPTRGAN